MINVFLGGTCNGSTWRDELIARLPHGVKAFNPVVANWTPECQIEELRQRENCDYCLYVLTPESPNTYSIAEVVDDSNKRPAKTIFYFHDDGNLKFEKHQFKAMLQIGQMVAKNGGKWLDHIEDIIQFLVNAAHNASLAETDEQRIG